MPTIQQLRYLAALADVLNFSRAAEICGVAQPTLSLQLRELEARLGVRLVERTRARVMLTPVGREVARRARNVIGEIEDIREIARRDDAEAPQAVLKLGVAPTVGAYVLSLAMPGLRGDFPHMRIRVREEREEMLVAQLLDGAHDMALLSDAPERPGLVLHPLIAEPLVPVLPADHALARRGDLSPGDLAGQTILAMEAGRALQGRIRDLCAAVGAHHASDYEGSTLDTLRQMVAAGMGLSLLPALYVRSEVMREQLVVARPLRTGAPVRRLTMVWRRGAPRQRTYRALAASVAASLAPWDAGGEKIVGPMQGL